MGRKLRLTTVALAATVMLATVAGPAGASSRYSYRSSDQAAQANWLEIDAPVNGIVGWHQGYLYAYQTTKGKADAYVDISDAYCPEGVTPSWGGGHGELPPDDPCTYEFRYGYGFGMAFALDKKLNGATLAGRLEIFGGHGGDPIGRPPVDMAWTGVGSTTVESNSYRYRTDCCWETFTYKAKTRSAAMSGFIGPMGFHPDRSGGFMSISTSTAKGGSK